jgi:hypothetical protein
VALVTGTTQPVGFPQLLAFFGGIFVAYYAQSKVGERESTRAIRRFHQ